MSETASTASGVAWDLRDLYQNVDDPNIEGDLATALRRPRPSLESYRGKIANLTTADVGLLLKAVAPWTACRNSWTNP